MEVVQDNLNITGQEAEAKTVNGSRLEKDNNIITVRRIFEIRAIIIVITSVPLHIRPHHRQYLGLRG
jgi:hypothetical protein